MKKVTVYGADWCSLTKSSLAFLEERGVEFQYIDVEKDPSASEWVKKQNGGKEKKPTIDIDGQILTEPSNEELGAALA